MFKNGMPCREVFPEGFIPDGKMEHLSSGKNSIEYIIHGSEEDYVLKISKRDSASHLISFDRENEILHRMAGSAFSVPVYRRAFVWESAEAGYCCTLMAYTPPYMKPFALNWFSCKEILELGIKTLDALIDCRSRGVVYTDLKPGHILRGKSGNVILCDFDSALSDLDDRDRLYGERPMGTPLYMAPEVFHGNKHTESSAIYSVGLMLELLFRGGEYPLVSDYFSGLKEDEALAKAVEMRMEGVAKHLIVSGFAANFTYFPDCFTSYQNFGSYDPAERPQTFEEARDILGHCRGYAMDVQCPFTLQHCQPAPCLPDWMRYDDLFKDGIEEWCYS